MKDLFRHLRDNLLFYTIAPLLIINFFLAYDRFIVDRDYLVSYEGECDPASESCFVGCEDEECAKEYYYSEMEKYATDLYEACGKDITDCEKASLCLPDDRHCAITYCDKAAEGNNCDIFDGESDQGETLEENEEVNI